MANKPSPLSRYSYKRSPKPHLQDISRASPLGILLYAIACRKKKLIRDYTAQCLAQLLPSESDENLLRFYLQRFPNIDSLPFDAFSVIERAISRYRDGFDNNFLWYLRLKSNGGILTYFRHKVQACRVDSEPANIGLHHKNAFGISYADLANEIAHQGYSKMTGSANSYRAKRERDEAFRQLMKSFKL